MSRTDEVIDDVAHQFGISRRAILGKCRRRRYAYPRAVVCYILHVHYGVSSKKVGKALNRNHATVLYHCKAVKDWLRMPVLNSDVVDAVHEVERRFGLTS